MESFFTTGFGVLLTALLAAIGWLIKVILKNNTELAVLNTKLDMLFSRTDKIPKIEQDINAFHEWKRKFKHTEV